MQAKCMRCGMEVTDARDCLDGAAVPLCGGCARESRIAATIAQLRSAAGYCRCGAYLAGGAEFIRHAQRCGDYGR
jgi:hypothetical protein